MEERKPGAIGTSRSVFSAPSQVQYDRFRKSTFPSPIFLSPIFLSYSPAASSRCIARWTPIRPAASVAV